MAYKWIMNNVAIINMKMEIAQRLLTGDSARAVSEYLCCDIIMVNEVLADPNFLQACGEELEKGLKIKALAALHNIEVIAGDDKASQATRLKANQYIVDKALEFNGLGGSDNTPANMSQRQLAERLKALQTEAITRAKPIDTGVIDHSLDDML